MKQICPNGGWRVMQDARPYTTVSGLAIDENGNFPILYRGPKVRSAANIWSLPSGLHEIGFTRALQFAVELQEECGLIAYPQTAIDIATYENIAPELSTKPADPQWHWVIHVMAIRVKTLSTFVNKEPDKHPECRIVNVRDIPTITKDLTWAPVLATVLNDNHAAIIKAADQLAHLGNLDAEVK